MRWNGPRAAASACRLDTRRKAVVFGCGPGRDLKTMSGPGHTAGSAEVHNGLEPRCFTGKKPITLDIA